MREKNTIRQDQKFDNGMLTQVLEKIAQRSSKSEHHPEGPQEEFQWLKDCGALAIVLPGELMDFNAGRTLQLLKLLKDIGQANLSVGRIFEGHINALYLIHLYARERQREKWYQEVRDHGYLFGIWNTQANDGVRFIESEGIISIEGSKTFCSGATLVNRALITGNISLSDRSGWQMAILDMKSVDSQNIDRDSWKTLGMKASGSYKVDFSGYEITEDEFLADPGMYLRQPYFNGGAIRFAAVQLGGAEAIAAHTLAYLQELNRSADQIQQMRISNIMTLLISGRIWLNQAAVYYDKWANSGTHDEELITFANMTRISIEEICLKIMDESNRCVGARGLMHPYQLERIYRDLSFYLRQPAPDATRLKVAEFFIEDNSAFNE
ncbi:acyl-CoA dehydrogenase family protein [Pedobacter sp. AW31-3R]|uniref:acyl-CoA dehydrogenase family protein n=1 Tax=Pedobacter sp. AW31-3R TaxID=3445781 RepID=UPI003FA09734